MNIINRKDLKMTKKKRFPIDDHFFTMHEYGIDYENNEIFLFGNKNYMVGVGNDVDNEPGVEYTMANQFITNMLSLMKKDSKTPILIHMKTCGGHWKEGMAIHNIIKNCPNPVTILNYTHARSMSSLVFLAANKCVMMTDSDFMFHDGTMFYGGTVKQFQNESKELTKTTDRMMNIYIDRLKRYGSMKRWSRKRIYEWIRSEIDKKEDVYFNAQESVKCGFAHEIFDGNWDNLTEYTDEQLLIK
jgi:ATP-dependent protease ClpP protease subunit